MIKGLGAMLLPRKLRLCSVDLFANSVSCKRQAHWFSASVSTQQPSTDMLFNSISVEGWHVGGHAPPP